MKPRTSISRSRPQHGFSLIEVLVSVVIGLVVTLVVSTLMIRSESDKRTITSQNDVNQTGAYLAYVLDRTLRSAGSGFATQTQSFGCNLVAAREGTTVLPRPSKFESPFADVPTAFRLAPVIIHQGASAAGSDVLAVMTGTSGFGATAVRVAANSVTSGSVRLSNTQGIRANDLVLLSQDGRDCMMGQVASTFDDGTANSGSIEEVLTLGGTFHTGAIGSTKLTEYGDSFNAPLAAVGSVGTTDYAYISVLGNEAANPPLFQLFGVGDNRVLFSQDILNIDGEDSVVPIADGVVELRALYGVDTDDNGALDSWVDPGTAPYDATTLLNGSGASQTNLGRIVAVRIGLVLRTPLQERDAVAPESLTLFSDLGEDLAYVHEIAKGDRLFRHRIVELTVPLRNNLL